MNKVSVLPAVTTWFWECCLALAALRRRMTGWRLGMSGQARWRGPGICHYLVTFILTRKISSRYGRNVSSHIF